MPGLIAEVAEKQRAFDKVFGHFDPNGTGNINSKDFLNVIDNMDALQPEDAEPIMSEHQRESAQAVVAAAITMSKAEVLEFLQTLGVELHDDEEPDEEERQENGYQEELQSISGLEAASLPTNLRPHTAMMPDRPRPRHLSSRSVSSQAATAQNYEPEMTMNTFDKSRSENLERSGMPLAQSTPNKESLWSRAKDGKENRRPTTSPRKSHRSIYSAVGEGTFSPSAPMSAGHRDAGFPFVSEEVLLLQDQVNKLQDRERASDKTIARNEEQIRELQAMLDESREEMSRNNRAFSELRTERKSAEDDVRMLERNVEQLQQDLKALQTRHDKIKSDLDLQAAELEGSTAAVMERNNQISALQAKIDSLDADRSSMLAEKDKLRERIDLLETEVQGSAETTHNLHDALERCNELEAETERLKFDLEQVKQTSLKMAREERRSWQNEWEQKRTSEEAKQERLKKLQRSATASVLNSKGTQTDTDTSDPFPGMAAMLKGATTTTTTSNAGQEESMRKRYAELSNELGLQAGLIEQMQKMRAGLRKDHKGRTARGKSPPASTSDHKKAVEERESDGILSIRKQWIGWLPLLALYSLVFLFLGFLIATQRSAKNAPGVSYAELVSWQRANALDFLLDHHGVLGTRPYCWWEGRWKWIEMAGYWLQDKLQDRPWPT